MITWKKWQQNCCAFLLEAFHLLASTVLTILLPLSFVLLARISCYNYLSTILRDDPVHLPLNPFLSYLFQCINPTVLYVLVSFTTAATLIYALTGEIPFIVKLPREIQRPHLCIVWIVLCTTQICVQLGAEWMVATGIDGSTFENGRKVCSLSKFAFFLGLHETMLVWSKAVVKPAVDDTIFGLAREERWPHRVAAVVSFGSLWWWKLRKEIESLVLVVEYKNELKIGLGVADFVGWWLYYLTSAIGIVKVAKYVLLFSGTFLILGRSRAAKTEIEDSNCDTDRNEDKV